MAYINRMLEQDDEFTVSEIHHIIVKGFSVWISSTIWCFFRMKLKCGVVTARTGQIDTVEAHSCVDNSEIHL